MLFCPYHCLKPSSAEGYVELGRLEVRLFADCRTWNRFFNVLHILRNEISGVSVLEESGVRVVIVDQVMFNLSMADDLKSAIYNTDLPRVLAAQLCDTIDELDHFLESICSL